MSKSDNNDTADVDLPTSEEQPLILLHRGILTNIYRINPRLVVKVTHTSPNTTKSAGENNNTDGSEANFSNEQIIFDVFEKHVPCPHIIQSFYRLPTGVTFLEFLPGGSLADRLNARKVFGVAAEDAHAQNEPGSDTQGHGDGDDQGSISSAGSIITSTIVRGVTSNEPLEQIEVWAEQLCRGAEWIESIGFAHCDIRPANLLLDGQLNLKLIDFERTRRVGEFLDGGTPPFVRLIGPDDARHLGDEVKYHGTYGLAGPRSEQFAIGSVLYCVTRGFEPFEDQEIGLQPGVEMMNRLKRKEFPKLRFGNEDYRLDDIIRRCWNGEYQSVKELADEVTSNGERRSYNVDLLIRKQRIQECRRLVEEGILERLGGADI